MTTRIQPWTEPELMDRESLFEAMVEKALTRTMRAVGSEVRDGVLTAAATLPVDPSTEGAYSALQGAVVAEWTKQVDAALYPFLTGTFTDSASRVVDGVQEASGIVVDQLTGTYADEVLQYAYNRMVGIGESLWFNIRAQLVEGYQAGEGISQIAERLTQVAGLTTPRALTVARTEIISAANNGSYLQMLEAGFDEAVTKVWLATEDNRTRLSHRHADDQGVELTGEFTVDIYSGDVKTGTEPMEFPGDPTATPGNIINCRCSLAFDFEDDNEEVLVSAKAFTEKDHPRDGDGKFKKKGSADKYIKVPDTAPANTAPSAEKAAFILGKKWENLTGGKKVAFLNAMTKDPDTWSKLSPELKEKIKDVPGHFLNPDNKKAAQKLIDKLLPAGEPDDDADTDALTPVEESKVDKIKTLINHTGLQSTKAVGILVNLPQKVWDALTEKEQKSLAAKAKSAPHPQTKKAMQEKVDSLLAGTKKTVPTGGGKRALGGIDTKTGKALVPGKSVKLRVQILYNTKFEDGAIMAVRKDSGERIIWNEKTKKIERQKLSGAGKYETTEALSRGAAYAAWKDEDGWTVPDASDFATPEATTSAPQTPSVAVGKPVKIKVQLIYQTPFDDGDIVAVNPTTGETIHWDAKKKRMIVTSELGTTEYTRGALYKEFKDEDGWHLPADKKAAVPAPTPAKPAPVAVKEPFQPVPHLGGENNDKLKAALDDPDVLDGTVLFEVNAFGQHTVIKKSDDGIAEVVVNGGPPAKVYSENAGDTETWLKAIGDSKKGNAAAVEVSTYVASDDANAIYQAWDTGMPGEVWSNGPFSVALAKNGNLLFLDAKPGGGVGVVKSADVNSENIDKALEAVMAGKVWTVDDAIPEVDPDEIVAPGGSQDVSAGQSDLSLTDSKFQDVVDDWADFQVDDVVYTDDAIEMTKVSKNFVEVFDKKTGKSFNDNVNSLTIEHITDFLELNAPDTPAVATPTNAVSDSTAVNLKDFAKNSGVLAGEELFNGPNFKIIKASPGSVVIYPKKADGYQDTSKGQVLFGDEITSQGIENTLSQMGLTGAPAPSPVVAPAVANVTVTNKTITSPMTQLPLKMSYGLLVNPKTTNYKDKQIIAENPSQGERLIWSATSKKFVVQVQGDSGSWHDVHKYSKQGAYKNLKDDDGWVTPAFSFAPTDPGATPGTAPVPSIAGAPGSFVQPQNLAQKVSSGAKPPSLFGPDPKMTISQLQQKADSGNEVLTQAQKNSLFSTFKSKGGNGTVYLSSSEKEQFEGLLETYVSYNQANPGSKLSLLQILRVVDEVSAKNANVTNNNSYENKVIAWLTTPAGTTAAQNIAEQLQLNAGSDKKVLAFNNTLAKFQETATNRAQGTASYKDVATIALNNQSGIKAHTPGQQYPQVKSVAEGAAINAEMRAKYGPLSDVAKKAMQEYTGSSYIPINNYLRSFGKSSDYQATRSKQVEVGMKPVTRAITVHRNVDTVFDTSWTPSLEQLKEFEGVTFREDAFASTSIAGNAFNGQKYRFIIEIPEGTPLQWVQTFSQVKSEDEFLLGSGLHYEIISVHGPNELSGPWASTSNKTAVVKMRVVPPPADAKAQLGVTK